MRGPAAFEEYYRDLYGDRWPRLRDALVRPPEKAKMPTPGGKVYELDPASILTAKSLPIEPHHRVLDACAAPGGKCLILAQSLGSQGNLIANDVSRPRRLRLKKVLDEHLTSSARNRIAITGYDVRQWSQREKSSFDRILLDAPCSSESHVLREATELQKWSPSRSKRLAIDQYAMLASCLDLLKPSGIMIYSTCSLAPQENDGVLQKLFDRRQEDFYLDKLDFPIGRPTQYGWYFLPDEDRSGPMYLSRIHRKP